MRLYGQAAHDEGPRERAPQTEVPGYGFCVHAERRVSAHDKAGREKLCRYLHRPPLAQGRLDILQNGNVRLGLKRAFRDGTTHVVFEPLDFLSKLAALVPPPRMHRTRYHGLWSSHAAGRSEVTPKVEKIESGADETQGESCVHKAKRYDWARLLARVFSVDVLSCPKCSAGRMQRVAFITEPDAIRKILRSMGLPADSPEPLPSRLGYQQELFAMGWSLWNNAMPRSQGKRTLRMPVLKCVNKNETGIIDGDAASCRWCKTVHNPSHATSLSRNDGLSSTSLVDL
jgi:hypothetical protein